MTCLREAEDAVAVALEAALAVARDGGGKLRVGRDQDRAVGRGRDQQARGGRPSGSGRTRKRSGPACEKVAGDVSRGRGEGRGEGAEEIESPPIGPL